MSRRLRVENERLQQLKDEEREEEDKLNLIRKRMYAPIVWTRLTSGFQIVDIQEQYFSEVLDIIKEYYVQEDVLTRNAEMINDERSLDSFLHQCRFQLQDGCSIMALHEDEDDKVAGVLLLRVINRADFGRVFSRTMLNQGAAQHKCTVLKNTLNRKVDIFVDMDCETFLRLYLLCVKPEYRRKGLGFTMMRTSLDVAKSLNVPVVMGIFGNFSAQKCAKRIGMQVLHEIEYRHWRDKDQRLIFDDPGAGNYTCALMAGKVPLQPTPEAIAQTTKKVAEQEEKTTPKVTRKEKRNALAKKNA